jgi:hypothetical protein
MLSSLPPMLMAALAGLAAGIPVAIAVARVFGPLLRGVLTAYVSEQNRRALHGAAKGAYFVVAEIAAKTPGRDIADSIAELLLIVSHEIEATLGRPPTPAELERAAHIATSMHADPSIPGTLGEKTSSASLPTVLQIAHTPGTSSPVPR